MTMEEQIPSSIPPQANPIGNVPVPGTITPEILEQMKQQAREMAISQYLTQQQRQATEQPVNRSKTYEINDPITKPFQFPGQEPKVVYVRRNLTVAEVLLVFCLSIGIVTGFQAGWNFISTRLPQVEIRMK